MYTRGLNISGNGKTMAGDNFTKFDIVFGVNSFFSFIVQKHRNMSFKKRERCRILHSFTVRYVSKKEERWCILHH
jgi:hypothetical protein